MAIDMSKGMNLAKLKLLSVGPLIVVCPDE